MVPALLDAVVSTSVTDLYFLLAMMFQLGPEHEVYGQ